MKIQSLAIIFILIILPITIVLAEYTNAQTQTLELETLYHSRLITATYDALQAFQINTFNDTQSDIADSKISSIEASINSFYNSMESSFRLQGYSEEDLKSYTPALVYTMYDGYYIYSPYTNIAHIQETSGLTIDPINTAGNNETIFGVKPYVYYSCRYKVGSDSDFTITYSLDNYISIAGMINGSYVKKSGYLISKENLTKNGSSYYYDGIEIVAEEALSEYLINPDTSEKQLYEYVKINGTKYYWNKTEKSIFYILNGTRVKQVTESQDLTLYNQYVNSITNNNSAENYYKNAYEFTEWLSNISVLKNLKASDAVDMELTGQDYKIFEDSEEAPFEYPNSNFNEQRKAVIRYSIESNLSIAIANFNTYSNSTNDFQMPKLKETEWELLQNQVSIISFLQGLNIGGKVYNGYSVVINGKTEEVIQDDDIYITTTDGYYHSVNDKHFESEIEDSDIKIGVLATDFEIRKDLNTEFHYLSKNELGCYTSIVNQENVNHEYNSIYEYLANTDQVSINLKQKYYIALGRERWGTFKLENESNLKNIFIVTDGLIRYYETKNNMGNGHSNSTTIWKDLSGHQNAIINGGAKFKDDYLELDGVDDWVNCGEIDVNNVTINMQMKLRDYPTNEKSYYLIGNWETYKSGVGLLIRPSDKKLYFRFYDGENPESYELITNNQIYKDKLYDITVTYDGKQAKIYFNGVCVKTANINSRIGKTQNNTVLAIGVNPKGEDTIDPWSSFAPINVYSVKVYNRALSQSEIQKNITASKNN